MKTLRLTALASLGLAALTTLAADDKSALKDQKDKVSYGIGMSIGSSLKMQGAEVNVDLLARAIKDTLSSNAMLMTQQEMQDTLRTWQTEMRNKRMEQMKVQGEENKKKGQAFLEENAKKPGVTTLPSGLQYKVLASGSGKSPTTNDTVKAHYKGTLIDGTEFDSSYTRGQPLSSPVTRLIRGWTEALLKMKVGDKWQLVIPGDLAYGERGSPPKIGPNATLVFEMELLGFEETKAPPPMAPRTNGPQIKLQSQ
jgi:FKBP-type peptidyl-prolyl cis-trans isomerase FklB